VLESVPSAPSAAVAAADDGAIERARARATTPGRLRAMLRGDLDTIALRALAKEPDRRYASALQFADDLDRWLNGRPVLARADTLRYRAGKFAGRHRAGVAAGALAVLLLVVAGAGLIVSAQRTTRALGLAEAERDRAATERDRAERTSSFLQGLFSASNPYAPRGRLDTLRVPALLAVGAAQARDEAALRPAAAAELLTTIASAYRGLGALDDAGTLAQEAAGLLRAASADPALLATTLNEGGVILLMQQRPADAEPLIREALELRERALPPGSPTTLTTRMNLASALQDQNRFEDAAPLYDDVLAALRTPGNIDSVRLAEALNARGALAHRTGDAARAIELLEEALAINRALLGDEHPRVAREVHNVAFVLDRAGRLTEAEPLYRLSFDLHRRLLGDAHPVTWLATTAYADALARLDRTAEARPLFEQVLPNQRAALGARSPDLAQTLRQYAALLERTGEDAAAEAAARENVDILLAAFGAAHPGVAAGRARVARLACRRGAITEAVALFADAGRTLQASGPSNPGALAAAADHGACLLGARRFDEAEAVLVSAWRSSDNGDPAAAGPPIPDGTPQARLAALIAELHAATGRSESADRLRSRLIRSGSDPQ
jgi:eukaryotic-like serine/threonine-protein kinase